MVAADGTLLDRAETLTEPRRGAPAVIETLVGLVRDLASRRPGAGALGVACAGQIDPVSGTVVYAPNLGWTDVPLAADLERGLGIRVSVENDVRAAAWGEFTCGAGRGAQSLLAVFVGTGVGSGAVIDGRLWRGAHNVAGEIGHTQVVPEGLPCPCGQRGCMEQYASGGGFQRRLQSALSDGRSTTLADITGGDARRLTSLMVHTAALGGDTLARELWADAERYLTLAVANYVTLFDPAMLILGGGVVETVPAIADVVAAGVRRLTTVRARELAIRRAHLGDWSGVVGAATLAAAAV